MCKDYLGGRLSMEKFSIFFNAFWSEYVASHGYTNLQMEGENESYINFCNYVLTSR
jgi:hypothetical protein